MQPLNQAQVDLGQAIAAGGARTVEWTYAAGGDDLAATHSRVTTAMTASATAADAFAALTDVARTLFADPSARSLVSSRRMPRTSLSHSARVAARQRTAVRDRRVAARCRARQAARCRV